MVINVAYGIYGDYAVCEGPQPYYWGGTWICGAAGSDNLETIKDVMLKLTCVNLLGRRKANKN